MNATTEEKWTPPYIAFRTMTNLIQRLRDEGAPPQIDRSFLSGSEGGKTQVLNAFKSLDLLGPNGEVLDPLTGLVNAEDEDRREAFKKLFEERYPKPVRLGTMNATQQQLEDAFREYGVSGDTLRKAVAFYLKGAEYAGLPVSKNFRTPKIARPATGRRSQVRSTVREESNSAPVGPKLEGPTTSVSVHTALAGVLMQLPPNGPDWTDERREQFKQTFNTVLDFSYPVPVEATGYDEEDEDYEE